MAAPPGSLPRLTSWLLNGDVAATAAFLPAHFSCACCWSFPVENGHAAACCVPSISRQSTTIPTVLPTSAVIFTPASVPPTPTVTHPPVPTLSTVIITSVLAPMPPTMISSTALGLPTAVYTTITTATLLTTYPTSAPGFSAFNTLQSSAPGSATSIIMPDASRGFLHSSSSQDYRRPERRPVAFPPLLRASTSRKAMWANMWATPSERFFS
ncbi:hypothetical protein B0H10DRAFT_453318 [Mycena sp. CBHHK59/15]|nr:hypothetical protein B0H10DRAFT_453318 [Mycena sp. CBHHK59/15]